MYNKVSEDIKSILKNIVGTDNIFYDEEILELYSRDETEDLKFYPEVVVKPVTAKQISEILKLCNENKIPITPRGGGTGLSGGALPVYGGIILSLEKMNRILEIDNKNFQAVAEPGVITQTFHEEVEKHGLFYPPDPASKGSCHLGGNLAECSGGPRAVKYGVTKDYVLGIEAVLPTGEILDLGARVLKNVSGYNLTQLIIGSEGTLAVITKIIFRLIPLPKQKKMILVSFHTIEDATDSVNEIFLNGFTPCAIEFMEKSAVKIAAKRLNKHFPNIEAGAHLFIEIDGNNSEFLSEEISELASVLEKFNPIEVLLAEDSAKIDEIWDLRRGISEAVKSISTYKEEDTVVPRANLTHLVKGIKQISEKYGIDTVCYGHSGDGNVHVNILKGDLNTKEWDEILDKAITEIFELTVSLGGTISGEHGIGFSQKKYLPIALSKEELKLMKSIKKLFDPNNILNPGKIFLD